MRHHVSSETRVTLVEPVRNRCRNVLRGLSRCCARGGAGPLVVPRAGNFPLTAAMLLLDRPTRDSATPAVTRFTGSSPRAGPSILDVRSRAMAG